MKSYSNTPRENYLHRNQILSSLVINPPYKIDGFTTSPKISKVLDFPLGLKVNSKVLIKSIYELVITLSSFMVLSTVFIICLYLPIQNQNERLSNTAKILTNEKLRLLVNLQEATSYNKLFSSADALSLKDSDEIIHININPQDVPKLSTKHINFKKYPSIQFSGF